MSRIPGMNSLWRTLSGSTGKEISHQHPAHALRPCSQSLDIEGRTGSEEGLEGFKSTSLPAHYSMDSAGSLSESLHSSSPTGSQIGAESPTAAQQHQKQRQQQRRPYKIQGMDPYDYWSMIKSL